MAIRTITTQGDPVLAKVCKPVKEITDRIKTQCQDMIDTMIEADGVGLASPQIGLVKRLFVCRPILEEPEKIFVMINPEITHMEGSQESTEGCLSVPGYVGVVDRPELVRIKAQDIYGVEQEYEFTGFAATCICHEYDHLDGILYVDKSSSVLSAEEYDEMLRDKMEEPTEE